MIRTAFDMRLERAHKLVAAEAVQPNGTPGHFEVASQSVPNLVYDVTVAVDHGTVTHTGCQCPDWERMHEALEEYEANPGVSQVDYSPACKHVLAALIELGVVK